MHEQASLFSEETSDPNCVALAIRGSARALSAQQKRFNKLIGEIAEVRGRLAAWQDYIPQYQSRVAGDIEPRHARLREAHIAMAGALDEALGGKKLTKRERGEVREFLGELVSGLLDQGPDERLAALAARHGFGDEAGGPGDMELLESLGAEMFGVELDEGHGAATPEELAPRFAEKMAADHATREARRKPRKKNAKSQQREALAERAAQDASQALREVYRKLASELHPDRIADADERARRTALMQEANRAYEARDLLALFELQWRIEQIDPARMSDLADEKLAHFNRVLDEQVQCLRHEIAMRTMAFAVHFDGAPPRDLRTEHIERELGREADELDAVLDETLALTSRYADPMEIKRDLKDAAGAFAVDDVPDFAFEEMLGQLMRQVPVRQRRNKTRAGKRAR